MYIIYIHLVYFRQLGSRKNEKLRNKSIITTAQENRDSDKLYGTIKE